MSRCIGSNVNANNLCLLGALHASFCNWGPSIWRTDFTSHCCAQRVYHSVMTHPLKKGLAPSWMARWSQQYVVWGQDRLYLAPKDIICLFVFLDETTCVHKLCHIGEMGNLKFNRNTRSSHVCDFYIAFALMWLTKYRFNANGIFNKCNTGMPICRASSHVFQI